MNTRFFVSSIAIGFGLCSVCAQTPGALDQLEQQQQGRERAQAVSGGESAPQLYEGESSDVGPQSILRMKPRRTWIQAQVDAQYFYTDNMLFTDQNKIDTGVLVTMAEVALAPTPFEIPCGTLAPRVGYRHQWFNFGLDGEELFPGFKLNNFDFNAQTVFSDLTWSDGGWDAQIGFDFQRLLDMDYNEGYREYVPRWRLQRSIPICERSAITIGYEGDCRFTDVRFYPSSFADFNDRTDHSLYATYTVWLCPKAIFQPFYRFKYTYFPDVFGMERNDYLHSFGGSLYWIVCPNFNVRLFAGYDIRCSDAPFSDYKRLDTGGGVNVNFRF